MAGYVLGKAAEQPDALALRVLNGADADHPYMDWSYGALARAVRATATGLVQNGACVGDKILMRLGNTVDFPIAYLGALAAGLVPVPTSAALTEPEVARIIAELSPRLILHDTDVACPHMPEITLDLNALRTLRTCAECSYHLGDPNRLGYIIYTSGTSGQPRAVAHAHRAIWARRMMFEGWYALGPEDRVLHAGAFNWTYTLGTGLMDPWTIGACAVIPAPGTPSAALPDLIAAHRATIFAAAPGVYRQMLKPSRLRAMPTLRHGLSAGEKLPKAVAQAWTGATGLNIYEAYGMSECSTFLSACPSAPADHGSLGRPQTGRRVALLGPDGPVVRGHEGTIAVHRDDPGVMLGYLNAPDETDTKMQGQWFVTGDQGVMGEDDQITYLGRNDDMMNAGGYRVSPIEVEQAMLGCDGITGFAAAQIEVKADTTVIAGFYTGPHALADAPLRAHAAARLAQYKCPRLFVHLPELPTGGNGKILRRALPAIYTARTSQ